MTADPDGFFNIRKTFVIWFFACTGTALMIATLVLWWGMPRWVPDVVVTESPWFSPSFEAVVHGAKQDDLRKRLAEWEPEVRSTLLNIADSRADLKRRKIALELLQACTPAPEITPRLMFLLADPDPVITRETVYTLATHKHPGLIKPLIDSLPSLNPDDAWYAAGILAELQPPFGLISSRLLTSPVKDQQMLGCLILAKSPDPLAITALIEQLGRHYGKRAIWPDDQLDWSAFALGSNPQPAALDAIESQLAAGSTHRLSAAQALFWRNSHKEANRIRSLFIRLATDPDPEVRSIALARMARYPDDEVIGILQKTIAAGGKSGLRAAKSLGSIANFRSPAAFPILISLLPHEDEMIRATLSRDLHGSPITDRTHNAAIIALLRDPDPQISAGASEVVDRLNLTPEERQIVDAHRRTLGGK